jgi:hypothetical protein
MADLEGKSFDSADKGHAFPNGRADTVSVAGHSVTRAIFEPGWRWSESLKPILGTDSCQMDHFAYIASGRIRVRADDGTEGEFGPGEVVALAPGHDTWTVGDEPAVFVDFGGAVVRR